MKSYCPTIAFVIGILLAGSAGGTDHNSSHAGAFLRMGLGAQAVAMGNSGAARPTDGFAIYYNPAGIPYQKRRCAALSYAFLTFDRQFYFAGVTVPLRPTAGVGLGWIHAGVKNIEGRNSAGYIDEVYSTGEDAIMLAFANAIFPQLSFGLNFKILRQQMVNLVASGVGFDFGLLYTPSKYVQLGVQLKDIEASYTWNTQKLFEEQGSTYREAFPQILKLGLGVQPHTNLFLTGDLELSDQQARQTHLGVEYNYRELAYVRAGMNGRQPTFGAGLAYGFILNMDTQLDYCFIVGTAGEGASHIFAWQFKF